MSTCVTCDFDPCECCGEDFTVLEGPALERTLIASLTGCVDQIRDIYTCLGARPYQLNLVWTRWSGGVRGEGAEDIVALHRVLPTPWVSDLTRMRKELTMIGMDEAGELRVKELSPRFTEDLLLGQDLVVEPGGDIPTDVTFYWEVFFPRPSGTGPRRRFTPKSAPSLFSTKFQWQIDLTRASEDRDRQGEIR